LQVPFESLLSNDGLKRRCEPALGARHKERIERISHDVVAFPFLFFYVIFRRDDYDENYD